MDTVRASKEPRTVSYLRISVVPYPYRVLHRLIGLGGKGCVLRFQKLIATGEANRTCRDFSIRALREQDC